MEAPHHTKLFAGYARLDYCCLYKRKVEEQKKRLEQKKECKKKELKNFGADERAEV